MNTTLTPVAKRPCGACGIPFPIKGAIHPTSFYCTSCSEAVQKGIRTGEILNQLWFERFWEMVLKLEKHRLRVRKPLTTEEYKALDQFKQAMHRSRTSIDLPGDQGALTDKEWATIAKPKLGQYRRHLKTKEISLLEALIAHAED